MLWNHDVLNSIHLVYVEYRLIFYRVQKKWTWPGSSALMWGFLEQIIFPLQNFMTKRWEIYCKAVQCNMFLSQPFLIFWPKHLSRPQVVALITEYWSENEEVALRNNILMTWSWSLFSPFHVWPHSFAGDGPHWRALCHQTSDNQVKDCQVPRDKLRPLSMCTREGVGEETRCATCVLQWSCLSQFEDTSREFGCMLPTGPLGTDHLILNSTYSGDTWSSIHLSDSWDGFEL